MSVHVQLGGEPRGLSATLWDWFSKLLSLCDFFTHSSPWESSFWYLPQKAVVLFTLLCCALPHLCLPSGPSAGRTEREKSNGICPILLGIQLLWSEEKVSLPQCFTHLWAPFASTVTTSRPVYRSWSQSWRVSPTAVCLRGRLLVAPPCLLSPVTPEPRQEYTGVWKMVSWFRGTPNADLPQSSCYFIFGILKSLLLVFCSDFTTAFSRGEIGRDLLTPFPPELQPYYSEINIVNILMSFLPVYTFLWTQTTGITPCVQFSSLLCSVSLWEFPPILLKYKYNI